jgi:tRNA(Ile)-lysidine synthase
VPSANLPHPEERPLGRVSKDALSQCISKFETLPLTLAELGRALAAIGGFEPHPFVAVAVSGGPDSLALTLLADRWARRRGGRVAALIVDHGLRPESAAEAHTVAGWLAARGIAHEVLVWAGDKPATGIQEAARAARYRLLAAWCVMHGCLHLLTAHHREDQAETYLIRRRAGSGVDGLAGMAAVRELRSLRLVRPLLGTAKARLAAFLDGEGQDYVRDPSNRDPAYERARLRLAAPEIEPALTAVNAAAAARIARERMLAALLARAVALHPAGFALIDPQPLVAAGELGEAALGHVARAVGGAAYPLRRARLARLRAGLAAAPQRARTLGGCRFVPWRGWVLVLRETARAEPPLTFAPGMSALWDRRFAAGLSPAAPAPLNLGFLGADGAAAVGRDAPAADNPLPRLVFPALPVWRDAAGKIVVAPHLGLRRATSAGVAALVFRPAVPLSGVGFTVV